MDMRLSGTVDAAIANPFIEPNSVQGLVRLDATVQGPPALTSVGGSATLSGGRFVAPGPGVAIGGIEARAQFVDSRVQLDVTGTADRGGQVAITGGYRWMRGARPICAQRSRRCAWSSRSFSRPRCRARCSSPGRWPRARWSRAR
jgi:translocation and assembly module TamB